MQGAISAGRGRVVVGDSQDGVNPIRTYHCAAAEA
jgi:hypothetical protein